MKAFTANWAGGDDLALLIFAEDNLQARKIAQSHEMFEDAEFPDVQILRAQHADKYGGQEGHGICESSQIMYELGWNPYEEYTTSCEGCGLFEWDDVKDSILNDAGRCTYCAKDAHAVT